MSDEGVEVQITRKIYVPVKDVIDGLSPEDISDFLSLLAEKLDKDTTGAAAFTKRADYAAAFANGLSEIGCRFLAEIVTNFHHRQYDK